MGIDPQQTVETVIEKGIPFLESLRGSFPWLFGALVVGAFTRWVVTPFVRAWRNNS